MAQRGRETATLSPDASCDAQKALPAPRNYSAAGQISRLVICEAIPPVHHDNLYTPANTPHNTVKMENDRGEIVDL